MSRTTVRSYVTAGSCLTHACAFWEEIGPLGVACRQLPNPWMGILVICASLSFGRE
jgi:hypothetical protein